MNCMVHIHTYPETNNVPLWAMWKNKVNDTSVIRLSRALKILLSTQQMLLSVKKEPVNIITAWSAVCSSVSQSKRSPWNLNDFRLPDFLLVLGKIYVLWNHEGIHSDSQLWHSYRNARTSHHCKLPLSQGHAVLRMAALHTELKWHEYGRAKTVVAVAEGGSMHTGQHHPSGTALCNTIPFGAF